MLKHDFTRSTVLRVQTPWRKLALLAAVALSVPAIGQAGQPAVMPTADNVTSITGERSMAFAESSVGVYNKWSQKVATDGSMSASDARAWSRQALAAFSSFTPGQLRIAQMATERWEIDLLMAAAPFAAGTSWTLAKSIDRPDIAAITDSVLKSKDSRKLGTLDTEDLVFTPVAPCRIADSRPSFGGPGTLTHLSTRGLSVSPGYTSYSFQGGSASNCGLTGIGTDDNVVLALALSTFSQSAAGYVTMFRSGTTNPAPFVVTQWFQAGVVNTSTVFVGTDCCSFKDFNIYVNGANTDYALDVVGYFARPKATALSCTTTTAVSSPIATSSGTNFYGFAVPAACPAGTTEVSMRCTTNNALASASEYDATGNGSAQQCEGLSLSNAHLLRANRVCCSIPGR